MDFLIESVIDKETRSIPCGNSKEKRVDISSLTQKSRETLKYILSKVYNFNKDSEYASKVLDEKEQELFYSNAKGKIDDRIVDGMRIVFKRIREILIPMLEEILETKDGNLMGDAGYEINKLGCEAAETVPLLIAVMKKENYKAENRKYAIESLGEIGPAAKAAVPYLESLAKGAKNTLSGAAKEALKKIKR